MSLILDNSVTMAWVFPEETTREIEDVFSRIEYSGALVPALWHIEVANVLQTAIRKGRRDAAFRDKTFAELAVLPIDLDDGTHPNIWSTIARLAERHDLTVYDAIYLELAMRRGLSLATLDGDLRDAATREGVSLLGL